LNPTFWRHYVNFFSLEIGSDRSPSTPRDGTRGVEGLANQERYSAGVPVGDALGDADGEIDGVGLAIVPVVRKPFINKVPAPVPSLPISIRPEPALFGVPLVARNPPLKTVGPEAPTPGAVPVSQIVPAISADRVRFPLPSSDIVPFAAAHDPPLPFVPLEAPTSSVSVAVPVRGPEPVPVILVALPVMQVVAPVLGEGQASGANVTFPKVRKTPELVVCAAERAKKIASTQTPTTGIPAA
jgi:hypothetical protein